MRRTTLGPVSSSQLNARPGMASRASMGAAKRRSIGPLSGASRRVSAAARPAAHALVPRNSLPRQSIGSNGRRSSAYSGRPSMSARGPNGRVADPRPISDKKFMNDSINTLMAFLAESGFDQPINQRALRSPSKKDVYYLFAFMFRLVDPNINFGERPEEDIIVHLRNLRYPFTLSKTALTSAGSPHSWPAQLAALMWLVELITYNEMAQKPDYSAQEEEEENSDKSFFEYLGPAYEVFLAGEDEKYNALEKEEAEKHEAHNQAIAEQVMDLGRQQQELKHRIEMAKATKASLPSLRQKKKDMLSDQLKLQELIKQTLDVTANVERRITKYSSILDQKRAGGVLLEEEVQKLQTIVNNQELSADEANRIAQESTRLKEQINATFQKRKQTEDAIFAVERTITEQQDEVEARVEVYKEKATSMKLMPMTAKNALGFDYEIVIDARMGGVDAAKALTQHLKSHTRRALQELKNSRLARTSAARKDKVKLEAQVEELGEELVKALENEQETAATLHKIEVAIKRERTKREDAIKMTLDETEEVEVKNAQLLNESATVARRAKAKQELEQASIAYAEMTRMYTSRIEKDQQQVAKALESCTAHKDMMDQAIASLEKELAAVWPAS